jgi:hypothetical protein
MNGNNNKNCGKTPPQCTKQNQMFENQGRMSVEETDMI